VTTPITARQAAAPPRPAIIEPPTRLAGHLLDDAEQAVRLVVCQRRPQSGHVL
jgi:hypothetical protein